jgi:serine/threonine protein kinase
MDCFYDTCKKPFIDQYVCDNCYITKYCSLGCKDKDFQSHQIFCRPRIFGNKDFVPVKTSKKILDVGTYGEVQLMQNINSNKLYAIKIIRKSLVSPIIPLKVLFREIMIHKTLIHPNIVRLVDHYEDISKIYIVLEFVEKGSLFDLIRRKIKLLETEACGIFVQICVGLNYLHQKNIIHRDIKPENLLISKDGIVKISDFGWSAQASDKKTTFCGTLDYMSPEMINSRPYTEKLDIWALGVLLYEMMHGYPPYKAKTPKELDRMISSNTYTVGPHVSKTCAQLITGLLQSDPENRLSLLDILKSQWVQEYTENKLHKNSKIVHPDLGEGHITSIIAKICNISFRNGLIPMIEDDILRTCRIHDTTGKVIHIPPDDQSLIPELNPYNQVSTSLYKKLGIDSGRATPIGLNSRNSSRRGSLIEYTPTRLDTSPPIKASRFSRGESSSLKKLSVKNFRETEEKKKNPPFSEKNTQKKFDKMAFSTQFIPHGLPKCPKPKSSFLDKFIKGLTGQ